MLIDTSRVKQQCRCDDLEWRWRSQTLETENTHTQTGDHMRRTGDAGDRQVDRWRQVVNLRSYCHLNTAVPILLLYFVEATDHREHIRLSLPSIMSLIAALLNGDIIDPEDEENHDDGPLNPTTLKQERRYALAGSGLTEDEEIIATSGPDVAIRAGGVMEGLIHSATPFPGSAVTLHPRNEAAACALEIAVFGSTYLR
ncbi:hypothetical protein DPX16_6828 [Anabarilius grahami]|uniref:Uncharacterized protein n=1 Tax=Anabarilius grahami TaxID=495550 RepID=A0A3N0Y6F6_ANAGA|nr:hypothetical protein DPX16_6828 [Anabarilius grahami]